MPRKVTSPSTTDFGNAPPLDAGSTQPAYGAFVVVVATAEVVLAMPSLTPDVAVVVDAPTAPRVAESPPVRPFGATVHHTTDTTSAQQMAATILPAVAPKLRPLWELATSPASCLVEGSSFAHAHLRSGTCATGGVT